MTKGSATVAQLPEFDEIIDVRSPAEFEDDHLPGAVSMPVLDNEQRAEVGTIYKQVSPFDARRLGGALVAQNLATHLLRHFQDKPRDWRPLVYCWRGGQRSGAFTTWLRMIGWDACQLVGGYKQYRREVIAALETLPGAFDFRIVSGPTGSAKTRVLEALERQGAQVLDLEGLAAHKGSVLGALPNTPQPSQKYFESLLHRRLSAFTPDKPVFVEAESRKIGRIHLPGALIERMRQSPCVMIDATREARIAFLLRDYAYLGDDAEDLKFKLGCLKRIIANETLERWTGYADAHDLPNLFTELVDQHYDPLYRRSQNSNYQGYAAAQRVESADLSDDGIEAIAAAVLKG